ncbi:hypothetical protein FGO68_gene11867 [Halteria grandinella]|uniref:Secreted protein n=1 Tax=Halteria grandinella TaxID=5974 RepID=A0A8J8NN25_HALGN|nr:hypothetical protein FGO68_gene11867 [Halteria grandinella]
MQLWWLNLHLIFLLIRQNARQCDAHYDQMNQCQVPYYYTDHHQIPQPGMPGHILALIPSLTKVKSMRVYHPSNLGSFKQEQVSSIQVQLQFLIMISTLVDPDQYNALYTLPELDACLAIEPFHYGRFAHACYIHI